MANIYVLEDDSAISGLIKVAVEMHGMTAEVFDTVKGFEEAISKALPDLALIDIMLPDGNGIDVLRALKSRYPKLKCIIISALGKEEDKVRGLNLGADDYVTKPFSVLELLARIDARLRENKHETTLQVGDVVLNLDAMSATLKGEPLILNKKEWELLRYFAENADKALPRERILIDVWGYEQGETRTLDNHVARLRKYGVPIVTVFGVGYKLSVKSSGATGDTAN